MFTIKHIHENGEEVLWAGDMPRYIPIAADKCAQAKLPGENGVNRVSFMQEDGHCQFLYGGIVYVMKDSQTVATYRLGRGPVIAGHAPSAQEE